jgi:hypothetical protein
MIVDMTSLPDSELSEYFETEIDYAPRKKRKYLAKLLIHTPLKWLSYILNLLLSMKIQKDSTFLSRYLSGE